MSFSPTASGSAGVKGLLRLAQGFRGLATVSSRRGRWEADRAEEAGLGGVFWRAGRRFLAKSLSPVAA